jgi:hypothetical protein
MLVSAGNAMTSCVIPIVGKLSPKIFASSPSMLVG